MEHYHHKSCTIMGLKEPHIICIIIILAVPYTLGYSCNGGLQVSDGYTVPQGDIILRYGEPLNITCNINDSLVAEYGPNASSRLYFTRNDEVIPSSMIDVLNSTSIRLYIANHAKVNSVNYYCWFCYGAMRNLTVVEEPHKSCESKNICFNVVSVGVAPQNITDFSCLSRNYQNLTCTWTPKNNYVKTVYNLTYLLQIRAARPNRKHKRPDTVESNYPFLHNCSNMTVTNEKISCFWDVRTPSQYRQSHEMFYFTLKMSNIFGTNENHFVFDHYKKVLPNPPENLTAVATSPHSIRLSWAISSEMSNFLTGLKHRILYQCEFYEKVWHFGAILTDPNKTIIKNHEYELKDLKYAHALCDFRISMKSKAADEDDESMWSENATVTVRTKSKIPDCPPKTTLGSFDIENVASSKHDVYIYWQQLRDEQRNGEMLSYIVEVENHPTLYPKITRTGAIFVNLTDSNYVFHIRSVNEIGPSTDKSTVIIPAQRLREPANFVKVEEYENNVQENELTWDPPIESASLITNYTIFWCISDMKGHCVDDFNWITVSKDVRNYSQSLPTKNTYIIAISANSDNSTSGMRWAACTVNANSRQGKIRNVNVNKVGHDFIQLAWELDCSNRRSLITGYIIYYCQIYSLVRNSCIHKEEKLEIEGDVFTKSAMVTGLKPYASYRLYIAYKIMHTTVSDTSDPVYNVTNAGPPSVPQHVRIYNITNATISLEWQPPEVTNGKITTYIIYYNNQSKEVNPVNRTTLTGLTSYETYAITIKACTINCSEGSPVINVTTKMSRPGIIDRPDNIFPNDTHITLTWGKPSPLGGKVDYYLVKMSLEDGNIERYENVTARNITIVRCKEKYKAPSVVVRAVNIIDGEHKEGPWSEERKWFCQAQYTPVIYILIGVSVIIIAVVMTCCFKKLYISVKDMKDIDVALPEGLERKVKTTDSMKSINKIGADEELLLNKMMKGGLRSSGDSSGCSSGHESITSSLESTTHISPSDSGTEQPRSPSLSEEKKNSLRQRNVPTGMRPTINKGYVLPDAVQMTNRPIKPSPVTGGSYCVLGVDPSTQTDAEPSYVPIPDVSTKMQLPFSDDSHPPPYVVTGDFIKTSNPGYVPYPMQEPASKNTGYVVAGLTNELVTPDLLQCDTPKPMSIEGKPLYVTAAETLPNLKGVQLPWQQPPLENTLPKTGYVSVGDAPPPKSMADVAKGYVPHRHFEAKSLKED